MSGCGLVMVWVCSVVKLREDSLKAMSRVLLRPIGLYARSVSSEGASDVVGECMSWVSEHNGLRQRVAEAAGGVRRRCMGDRQRGQEAVASVTNWSHSSVG